MDTRTTVTVQTDVANGRPTIAAIDVGPEAQKHVLRSFNPERNVDVAATVDTTKALCAALIQQQINLINACTDKNDPKVRAAWNAIELVEAAQMQCVKANFVQA